MRGVKVSIASFQSLKNEFKREKTLRKKVILFISKKGIRITYVFRCRIKF